MQRKCWGLMSWFGGTGMRMNGESLPMLVLTDWLLCQKEELINGEGFSVCIMAGASVARVTVNLSLRLPQTAPR